MATPRKVDESTPEVFTNEDDFMRELEGYTAVTEDEGYPVDFGDEAETFKGTFTGTKVLPVKDPEGEAAAGRPTTWTMLTFTDEKGERCNMPANYRLDEALKLGLEPGQQVMIRHHGMRDIGNGRTLNRLSVYVKK